MSETTNTTQSRWKSKVLWAAIIVQVFAILSFVGFFQWVGVSQELVGNVVGGVLELLVIIGVVNDPTNKTGW